MFQRLSRLLTGLLAAAGCTRERNGSPARVRPGTFTLREIGNDVTSEGTLLTWLATSRTSATKPFTFRLVMFLKKLRPGQRFCFSEGAIIREPGMNGTEFLKEVAQAIDADVPAPENAEHLDRLDFATTVLGTSLSRHGGTDAAGGMFSSTPPGDWIALKLFLSEDEDEGVGEVFLNINPVLCQGEFSTKDPEYAGVVLGKLARVFLD